MRLWVGFRFGCDITKTGHKLSSRGWNKHKVLADLLKTNVFRLCLCQHAPTRHNNDISISFFYARAYAYAYARLHNGPQMHDPDFRANTEQGIPWMVELCGQGIGVNGDHFY